NLSDPTTPYQVEQAKPVLATLILDVLVDSKYMIDAVLDEIRQTLTNTKTGLLAPENIGIGRPLFRSKIFAAVLSVRGASAVRSIHWRQEGTPFSVYNASQILEFQNPADVFNPNVENPVTSVQPFIHYAQTPGAGKYFDLEHGTLQLNGKSN
ncbi:MAG TPA: hypothetical protein PK228_16910, partial [Saprospiraceae bacterium]|nr:hypothetical protein [Saprospiraceae bacterium]